MFDLLFKKVQLVTLSCDLIWRIGGPSHHEVGLCLSGTRSAYDFLVVVECFHLLVHVVFLRDLRAKLETHVIATVLSRSFLIRDEFVCIALFTKETLKREESYLVIFWLCWCTRLLHLWNLSSSSFLPCLLLVPPEAFKNELFCHWFCMFWYRLTGSLFFLGLAAFFDVPTWLGVWGIAKFVIGVVGLAAATAFRIWVIWGARGLTWAVLGRT